MWSVIGVHVSVGVMRMRLNSCTEFTDGIKVVPLTLTCMYEERKYFRHLEKNLSNRPPAFFRGGELKIITHAPCHWVHHGLRGSQMLVA